MSSCGSGVGFATVGAVVALLLSFRPDIIASHIDIDNINVRGAWLGPAALPPSA